MAKQKSIIKIQGTLDDMTFYQLNGQNFVKRKSSGITKEKINSDPKFKRTKENNQEFGGATSVSQGIRQGFTEVSDLLDNSSHLRMVSLCREIIGKADGIRGQRPFLPAAHKEVLLNLVLQKNVSLDSVFKAPYTATVAVSRNSASLAVPDFNTANLLQVPSGATHFRILLHVSALSSYAYDVDMKKYIPSFPEHNGKHAMAATGFLAIGGMTGIIPPLTTLLQDVEELPEPMVILACVGIQFYQAIGTTYYQLASNDTLKIVAVK